MKKLKKLFALVLCLLILPCSVLLVGCDVSKKSGLEQEKTAEQETNEENVKGYMTTDLAWTIYSSLIYKCDNHLLSKYDNVKANVSQNYNGLLNVGEVKWLKDGDLMVQQNSYVGQLENGDIAQIGENIRFKLNDSCYLYDIFTNTCTEEPYLAKSLRMTSAYISGGDEFSQENIVSGKILTNDDYVISLYLKYLDDNPAGYDSISVEITLTKDFLIKETSMIIKEKDTGKIMTTKISFEYGVVSKAEMEALIEEAKTLIAE